MPSRRDLANAIRALSMDAVQKANSGHPGAPMGMADIAEVLWNDFLQHNPTNPNWANRDRFVLSNGHGSMLLYSLLHLTGYQLPIDELKQFRQLHSKTPGHPEYGYAPGVETTTGPLGQGITNAVGFAIAERALAGQFNRPGHEIVDHYTYAFLGDGCLMEGISHEACSLAGSMKLGKLIAVYDDNNISIDGEVRGHGDTPGWFLDDTPKRFEAYGWHVIPKVDGHNPEAVKKALEEARSVTDRPTLICCQTIIGWGSPNKEGKEECHGAALGEAEITATRERIGWPHAPFEIPADIYAGWDAKDKGARQEAEWNDKFAKYQAAHPELAAEFERRMSGQLPSDWSEKANAFIAAVDAKGETIASRKASQNTLNGFGPLLPELMGGSADLAGSNLTLWSGCKDVNAPGHDGNYVYYGVREFGMSAIMNGITLHGGFKPYGATFLMFSEYARNALRMASLMKIPTIFVYTHDSIGLGEDGPTHQPIEQTATLRMIPNMQVWRPCDAVESAVSWKAAIERNDGPSCLIFSRQNLAHIARTPAQIEAINKGGYILKDSEGQPDVILIATGSEVELAVKAADELSGKGKKVRVVSMPSTNVFDAQDEAYRESVLPSSVTKRVVIEAGVTDSWWKYAGTQGCVIGMDRFGESAPAGALFKEFGFTVDNVVKHVEALL
ncbi:transketolase [Methylotuvimicrobium alcaliphilum]|uniref:Transketolase n=1 Tax=Methylotuvimicrobium alcaliphilum (strain DSM 19304 / NCIMB 14124 / VKM B-2133 / 20Z) TaxID=1091494 RepID=G4T0K3_META2|nr:transketolase [Methylotuvimicrobium alcaliphilum]CCE25607.1 Transketolase [Methylotuvimicrobium alcaliphilum 20Z]